MRTASRRRFVQGSLALAGLGVLSGCGLVQLPGQQVRLRRIGYLAPESPPTSTNRAFVQGLRDLGYVEGQNIEIEYRWAEGREERLPELAAELAALQVDVLVSSLVVPALVARDASRATPIVFCAMSDPVGTGLADSLARPGGHMTGLSQSSGQLAAKRVELLKDAVPTIGRLAAIAYAPAAAAEQDWNETDHAARRLGLAAKAFPVTSESDLEPAFAAMVSHGSDALVILSHNFFARNRERLLSYAAQHRLPTMYQNRIFTDNGGLVSYGPDLSDLFRRAAGYVDKILKGTKPADLPIEQPTTFDFVVNLKTARELGITVPQSVLQRATEVIQ